MTSDRGKSYDGELLDEIQVLEDLNHNLRMALKLARQCVIESFDYVKSTDDQYLAEARLRDIDAALASAE